MSPEFDRLNRLRQNAGKAPLKSWKGSQEALGQTIQRLLEDGYSDALPGANLNAVPVPPPDLPPETVPLSESKLKDSVDKTPIKKEDPPIKKSRAQLARGIGDDRMAQQSRMAIQIAREQEKKENKKKRKEKKKAKIELSEADKKQIKDEAEHRIAGRVDPKKDPEKAKRQEKHVKDKQEARAKKPKPEKNKDEVTVADIARDLDIDPKVARAKLRRHEDKLTPLHTKGQDRWTFPKSAREKIANILSGKKEK